MADNERLPVGRQILAHRVEGMSGYDLSRRLQMSEHDAHEHLARMLGNTAAVARETVEEVRAIELQRLEEIHAELWKRRGELRAVKMILEVMARRAELLGLNTNNIEDVEVRIRGLSGESSAQRAAELIARALERKEIPAGGRVLELAPAAPEEEG